MTFEIEIAFTHVGHRFKLFYSLDADNYVVINSCILEKKKCSIQKSDKEKVDHFLFGKYMLTIIEVHLYRNKKIPVLSSERTDHNISVSNQTTSVSKVRVTPVFQKKYLILCFITDQIYFKQVPILYHIYGVHTVNVYYLDQQ